MEPRSGSSNPRSNRNSVDLLSGRHGQVQPVENAAPALVISEGEAAHLDGAGEGAGIGATACRLPGRRKEGAMMTSRMLMSVRLEFVLIRLSSLRCGGESIRRSRVLRSST